MPPEGPPDGTAGADVVRIHRDRTAHEADADPHHIGRTQNQKRGEQHGHETGQQPDAHCTIKRMHDTARRDAGCGRKADAPPARQRTGQHEEHIDARKNDDAKQKCEEKPEIFGIGHVSWS